MSNTPVLALPYLISSQAQKEITHNEALNDVDMLAQASVMDRTINTPPVSPTLGDSYIIGTSPTGAWSGMAGRMVGWFSGWKIKTPRAGWRVWVRPENRLLVYSGSGWSNLATPFLETSTSWTPGAITAGAGVSSTAITLSGVALGDFVQLAAPYDLSGITATAYISAANSLIIRLHNSTTASISLGAGSWKIRVSKA